MNITQKNIQKKHSAYNNKGALLKEATGFNNLNQNGSIDIKMEGVIKVPLYFTYSVMYILYIQIIVRKLKEKKSKLTK